jgi:hypothetical protein
MRGKAQVANSEYMGVIGKGTITLDILLFGRVPAQVKLLEVLHAPPRRPPQPDFLHSVRMFKSKGDERGMIIRRKADGLIV